MKKIIVFAILFVLLLAGCADRNDPTSPGDNNDPDPIPTGTGIDIEGRVEGRFGIENSPYRVIGDLVIDSLATLTIDAGVTLLFAEQRRMLIDGELNAIGTQDRPIIFRADSTSWEGIKLLDATGPSNFQFCVIQDVDVETVNGNEYGALEVRNSTATVRNTIFQNNAADFGGAIAITDGSIEVVNSVFHTNKCITLGGAIFSSASVTKIINNTFFNNFALNVGGGIVFLLPVETEIQNNIFFQNTGFSGDNRVQFSGPDSGMVIMDFNFLEQGGMDPLFISDTDLHLQTISPAKNIGNPNTQFNDLDGTRNDLGAYGGPGGDW